MATYAMLTLLWDEKYHNDCNKLIQGDDIDRIYSNRYKVQVTESLRFLANKAYITVDNNEKEDVVGIKMYSGQLDENVLGKHTKTYSYINLVYFIWYDCNMILTTYTNDELTTTH